jgi:hypothetical protein
MDIDPWVQTSTAMRVSKESSCVGSHELHGRATDKRHFFYREFGIEMAVFAQKPPEISGPFPAQLRMEMDSLPERKHSVQHGNIYVSPFLIYEQCLTT